VLVLGYLSELLLVVMLELRIVSFYRVGGFNKVIAEEPVTRLDSLGIFGFKFARLVLLPCETCVLRDGGLVLKSAIIADFGQNAGALDAADAGDDL
jgi:hypothetical protein